VARGSAGGDALTGAAGKHHVAPASPIPLYYQVANVLQSRIFSGRYPPGSLVGTEKELAAEFGVSRITIQKALDALTAEGLIVRHRARGTFVSVDVHPRAPVELHGFLDDIIVMGEIGETRHMQRDEIAADAAVAERLRVPVGACVTRVRRLRAPRVEPNTWVVNYLPPDLGRRFTDDELRSQSVIQLIDRLPGFRLTSGHQVITATAADVEAAAQLRVDPGTAILLVERELQTEAGRIVDYARFHYLGHPQSVHLSRVRR
jgi:GntR family transcriptional regulator